MRLKLIKITEKDEALVRDMLDEWYVKDERIVPSAITKGDYRDFAHYIECLKENNVTKNHVPATTYFCLDEERNILVGAVSIRHYLNEQLLINGGHIGDGIRPSERGKGFGTEMVRLALVKCRELGIDKVLMVCDKNNVPSRHVIINNGGILENEIEVKGIIEQRFWIDTIKY